MKNVFYILFIFATMISCGKESKSIKSEETGAKMNQWVEEAMLDKYGEPTDKIQKTMILNGKLKSQPAEIRFTLIDSMLVFQVKQGLGQIPYDTENVDMLVRDESGNELKFKVTALYGEYKGFIAVQKESDYSTPESLIKLLEGDNKLNFLIENNQWKHTRNRYGDLIFKKS